MTTKATYILTILILTCGLLVYGQNLTTHKPIKTKSNFLLTISTYNHAERIFNGTLTYKLDDSILTISRRAMFSNKDTTLLSKTVDSNSLDRIKNIRLDSLKDFYFNYCIMATSGNEYFVSITTDQTSKKINLHCYYEPQVARLINKLNKHR